MSENKGIGPIEATIYTAIGAGIFGFFPALFIKVIAHVFGLKWGWWWPCYGIGVIIVSIIMILKWIDVINKKKQLREKAEATDYVD